MDLPPPCEGSGSEMTIPTHSFSLLVKEDYYVSGHEVTGPLLTSARVVFPATPAVRRLRGPNSNTAPSSVL